MEDVEELVARLKHSNGLIRREAARSLGEVKDPEAVPALIEALQDRDVRVRQDAAWALGEIQDARALPCLCEALQRWDKDVRRTAAVALGEIGDRHAITALIAVLLDNDGALRLNAAQALGKIAVSDPAPTLRLALPMLERLWLGDPAFAVVARRILAATTGMKNLPLPASAPAPDVKSLPRPAADAPPVDLVTPPRGLWVRLRTRRGPRDERPG